MTLTNDNSSPVAEKDDPNSNTGPNRYLRILLLIVAFALVVFFAWRFATKGKDIIYLLESVVVMSMLGWLGGPRILRVGILVALTVNVISILSNSSYLEVDSSESPSPMVTVLLICLLATLALETGRLLQASSRKGKTRILFWLLLAVPMFVYVVGIPATELAIRSYDDPKQSIQDPNWSILNEVSFRSAKFAVFALFTYLGACLGSFLNVVAYSLPRGQSVGMRDSSCPKCNTKITRIDNLPIFSYLNLGGSCRSCKTPIPVRYLAVEVIAALIFGSLFLYELVTGCANVPLYQSIMHKGILWIILYPKWHVIGIYLYHAFFMCGLLTLALIEVDAQRLKWWHACLPLLLLMILAACLPALLTIPVSEKLTFFASWDSGFLGQALRPLVGGLAGLLAGCVAGFSPLSRDWRIPVVAFAAVGAVLGWQSLLQVTILFVLMSVGCSAPQTRRHLSGRPTLVLLAAVMLHHPFWKMLFELW